MISVRALLLCLVVAFAGCRQAVRAPVPPAMGDAPAAISDLDRLRAGFASGQTASRPLAMWHWVSGNVTETAITRDLEMLKDLGFGGVMLFTVDFFWEGRAPFGSERYWALIDHALRECERLGLVFGPHNSDGWSQSGGPWITPSLAMKELVFTETSVYAGEHEPLIARPDTRILYEDISVLAFPTPPGGQALAAAVTGSTAISSPENLVDGNRDSRAALSLDSRKGATVLLDLGAPHPVRSLEFENIGVNYRLEVDAGVSVSEDGIAFRTVAERLPLTLGWTTHGDRDVTKALTGEPARYVKLDFTVRENRGTDIHVPATLQLGGIAVRTGLRIDNAEQKAARTIVFQSGRQPDVRDAVMAAGPGFSGTGLAIDPDAIVDLTGRLRPDGRLDWTAPDSAPEWTVLRSGYTLTLRENHPASEAGTGLESDKLNAAATRVHFDNLVGRINARSLATRDKPLDFFEIDSWEVRAQTWTDGFEAVFEERRGYSLLPYLPAIAAGYVVKSPDVSTRVLYDYRLTIAELMIENYFGEMKRAGEEVGIPLLASEASGEWSFLYDATRYMAASDWPMGELWVPEAEARVDIRNAASVAAVRGTQIAGVEAYTGRAGEQNWRLLPEQLKYWTDRGLAAGANLFVFHSVVLQVDETPPGMTLLRWGTPFSRLNPWFSRSEGWIAYHNRAQYLLQSGHFSADIAILKAEGAPSYLGTRAELGTRVPEGYDYLGVDAESLAGMQVIDGRVVAPGGPQFAAIVIRDRGPMTLGLLRTLERLVTDGALLIGDRPQSPPGQSASRGSSTDWQTLSNHLWGEGDAIGGRQVGRGRVFAGQPVADALKAANIAPVIQISTAEGTEVDWLHRKAAGADIYFIASRAEAPDQVTVSVRDGALGAEIWDPVTGTSRPVCVDRDGPRYVANLDLAPLQSVFLVFAGAMDGDCAVKKRQVIKELEQAWQLRTTEPGNTIEVKLNVLGDLSLHREDAIAAPITPLVYETRFVMDKPMPGRLVLSLGNVAGIVHARLNGIDVGSVWTSPFELDVTGALKEGENRIELELTAPLANAMILEHRRQSDEGVEIDARGNRLVTERPAWFGTGDAPRNRRTFVTYDPFRATSPLDPIGIFGPVTLRSEDRQQQ